MAPKDRDGKRIFATPGSAPSKRKTPEVRGKKAAPPSRPMVELEKRLAAEARRPSGRLTLTGRVGRAFPLFGFIGIREFGLIVAIGGGVMTIWHDLRPWGFLVAALGLIIMRSGPSWYKGPGEE